MEYGHVILVGFYFSPSQEESLLNGEEVAQDPIFKFDLYSEQEPWKHLKQKRKEAVIQSEPEPGKYFVMCMVGRSMVVCGSCLSFILINRYSFPTNKNKPIKLQLLPSIHLEHYKEILLHTLSPNYPEPPANPTEDASNFAEQPKLMSAALVQAAKQFDAVAALPLASGVEEAQLKRIAELQAENDTVGQEHQRQLEAAEEELKLVRELLSQAADICLNLKKPD